MKKMMVLLVVLTLVFALAACANTTNQAADGTENGTSAAEQTDAARVAGGWERVSSPEVTTEMRALLEKAADGMVGMTYTPIAYVGTQIVAGRNHCILCTVAPVVPDAEKTYALVYVYEDLDGNAQITQVRRSETQAGTPGLMGGWSAAETPVLTEKSRIAFKKAIAAQDDMYDEPIALLSTQVVAGMNYRFLCAVTSAETGESDYKIVQVYADLQDGAEVTDTFSFSTETAQ